MHLLLDDAAIELQGTFSSASVDHRILSERMKLLAFMLVLSGFLQSSIASEFQGKPLPSSENHIFYSWH